MSQAQKIYEYMARINNRAADKALVLALRRAEPPYRVALLETILDRSKAASTTELIRQYHQLPDESRELMFSRAKGLYSGLRQAAGGENPQTRLNTLTFIKNSLYFRLADVVNIMLRDQQENICQKAGAVLVNLAQVLANEKTVTVDEFYHPVDPIKMDKKTSDRQMFLSSLKTAVHNYDIHRRSEAVLAAMYLVPADAEQFWEDHLEPFKPVGKAVRVILTNFAQENLAPFCVSALKHPSLRTTAAKVIANNQNSDFIGAVAREVRSSWAESLSHNLKFIKQLRWLSDGVFRPEKLNGQDQRALVGLVAKIGAQPQDKTAYLLTLAEQGDQKSALKAVAALVRMDNAVATEGLVKLVKSHHELVALAALKQVVKKEHTQLHRIMISQLNSTHQRVRALAQRYYRDIAFESYWDHFDSLSRHARIAAGKVVYKIDPEAHQRWLGYCRDRQGRKRLKAVRMSRLLGRVNQCADTLRQLAHDPDDKVRSCAVASLGELDTAEKDPTMRHLVDALHDKDQRVQANAIEALEVRGDRRIAKKLEEFTESDNNRARANAIKALLTWRVAGAEQAIQKMVTDTRIRHRQSACWVVRTLEKQRAHKKTVNTIQPSGRENKKDQNNVGVLLSA